jgi:hypothetical protein
MSVFYPERRVEGSARGELLKNKAIYVFCLIIHLVFIEFGTCSC